MLGINSQTQASWSLTKLYLQNCFQPVSLVLPSFQVTIRASHFRPFGSSTDNASSKWILKVLMTSEGMSYKRDAGQKLAYYVYNFKVSSTWCRNWYVNSKRCLEIRNGNNVMTLHSHRGWRWGCYYQFVSQSNSLCKKERILQGEQ